MTTRAPWATAPWRWMAVNACTWAVLAALFAIQGAAVSHGRVPLGDAIVHSLASFAPCLLLTPLLAFLATRFRFSEAAWRAPLLAHTAGVLFFIVVGGAMMGAAEWAVGARPNRGLVDVMGASVIGYLAFDVVIYAAVIAAMQAILYARESRDRAVSEAVLVAQLAEARLHVLSSQLQPHFLFNTLNAISALVREEPQQAERLLAKLSDLLRHVLQGGGQSETSLARELTLLEKYVELQTVRFGSRLSVEFRVDPGMGEMRVPYLLLQPLVENAIRHGTSRRASPGMIEIGALRDHDRLQLFVRDNGAGIPESGEMRDGIGLSSTKARLRQLYGDDHSFAIERIAAGGTLCRMSLPLRPVSTSAA